MEIKKLLGLSAFLLAASWTTHAIADVTAHKIIDWDYERRHNNGYGPQCEYSGPFEAKRECENSDAPNTVVWGDSVAMYWVYGLLMNGAGKDGLIQATMSTCGPLLDVSPVYSEYYDTAWAHKCLDFNDTVFAYIKNTPSISRVILSSIFLYYVEPGQNLFTRSGTLPQGIDSATRALVATLKRIVELGKTPIIIAPVPVADFDVGECLEKKAGGQTVTEHPDCQISYAAHLRDNGVAMELLKRVQKESGVKVIWPSDLLCDNDKCKTELDGMPLYRDRSHLSYAGSVKVVEKLELTKKLMQP